MHAVRYLGNEPLHDISLPATVWTVFPAGSATLYGEEITEDYFTSEKEEGHMPSIAPQPLEPKAWKELYLAALLEGDHDRIPSLIAEAERAILERARVLCHASGDHIQEEEAIDDALYALHALKNCLAVPGGFGQAA
jgi:hypothetical protein